MEKNNQDNTQGEYVKIEDFAAALELTTVFKGNHESLLLNSANINRPGLLLAGFQDYFGMNRLQIIGNAEYYYLQKFDVPERIEKIHMLFERHIPCLIFSRGIEPSSEMINAANIYNVPLFLSNKATTSLITELSNYMSELLAPTISTHGVLLEVSGLGVLLIGRTGMGKSETALELIHRGHRLVADDAVILKRIQNQIIGSPPERIKHFMEIRGIGIIDICSMFGVGSVLDERNIDLVIELNQSDGSGDIDRLQLDENTQDYLGVALPILHVPVVAGRNLAIVVEVACRNQRLKQLGYNALDKLLENCSMK